MHLIWLVGLNLEIKAQWDILDPGLIELSHKAIDSASMGFINRNHIK